METSAVSSAFPTLPGLTEHRKGRQDNLARVAEFHGAVLPTSDAYRSLHEHLDRPIDRQTLVALGTRLSESLLPTGIRAALGDELRRRPPSTALRLHLHFQTPTLAAVPWEYTYLSEPLSPEAGGCFLALRPDIHIVRGVAGAESSAFASDPVETPDDPQSLRILIASSNPGSAQYPSLPRVTAETAGILRALTDAPECHRIVSPVSVPSATPAALQQGLLTQRPQILHFAGHGESRPTGARLIMQGERPDTHASLYVEELASWVAEAGSVQLCVLSSCGTPEAAHGIAQTLIRHGSVEAVVVMQFPFRDGTAPLFARAFYACLGQGNTLEESLNQARQAIQGAGADWGVAALYSRSKESLVILRQPTTPLLPTQRSTTPHNLPRADRTFLGRALELAELTEKICVRGQRLVTVTAIGGMGKTRMATEVGFAVLDHFPDGVYLIECDALRTREDVVGAILRTLGIRAGSDEPEQAIVAHVAGRRILLVLDCLERIVDEVAPLLNDLLRLAPDLHLLATSRIVLGLPREYEYPLYPITARPLGAGQLIRRVRRRPQAARESMVLFQEAAQHVRSGFQPTPREQVLIRRICAELEGIPLAMILAAGRLRYLSLTDLLAQIRKNRFETLRRRPVGIDRHAALQEVIGDSFLLLPVELRRLLCWLSVFEGGFYLEDARAICCLTDSDAEMAAPDGNMPGLDERQLQEGIARLRENSLIQVQLTTNATGDIRGDTNRFKLLDTVREYLSRFAIPSRQPELAENESAESLFPLPQELREMRVRHARHYADYSQSAYEMLSSGSWSRATERVWQEIGNLRAATERSVREEMHEITLRFANTIARLYFEMGLWSDFERLASSAEIAFSILPNASDYARLLGLRGALASRRGDDVAADTFWMQKLALCDAIGDTVNAADILMDLAGLSLEQGHFALAKQRTARLLRMAKAAKQHSQIATAYTLQARIALRSGKPTAAAHFAEKAMSALDAPACGHQTLLYAYPHLGHIFHVSGDLTKAESVLDRAVQMASTDKRPFDIARAMVELAAIYHARGETGNCIRAYAVASSIHRELGSRQQQSARERLENYIAENESEETRIVQYHIANAGWQELLEHLAERNSTKSIVA